MLTPWAEGQQRNKGVDGIISGTFFFCLLNLLASICLLFLSLTTSSISILSLVDHLLLLVCTWLISPSKYISSNSSPCPTPSDASLDSLSLSSPSSRSGFTSNTLNGSSLFSFEFFADLVLLDFFFSFLSASTVAVPLSDPEPLSSIKSGATSVFFSLLLSFLAVNFCLIFWKNRLAALPFSFVFLVSLKSLSGAFLRLSLPALMNGGLQVVVPSRSIELSDSSIVSAEVQEVASLALSLSVFVKPRGK